MSGEAHSAVSPRAGTAVWLVAAAVAAGLQAAMWGGGGGAPEAASEWPRAAGAAGAALAFANAFFLFNLFVARREHGPAALAAMVLGYLALFALLAWLVHAVLLFVLAVLLYGAMLHRPGLIGYLFLFVVSFVLLSPYSLPIFVVSALGYGGLVQMRRAAESRFVLACFGVGFVLLIAVLLPVLNLCSQCTPQTLLFTLNGGPAGPGAESLEVRRSLKVSLLTSCVSTAVVVLFGAPLAYAMSRGRFRGQRVLDALIDAPILIPPLVVGIALLLLLGPDSPLGAWLKRVTGARVDGSLIGIVLAQIFVSSPFLVRSAMIGFDAVDPRLERVARTLGAAPWRVFFLVTLPLAARSLVRGAVLSWARAVSEFGSLLVLAYRPFTAPTLIYNRFTERGLSESSPIAVLLVLMCVWVFFLAQFVGARPGDRAAGRRPEGAA